MLQIKNVNKKEIYIILLITFDAKLCVLAKQCGAMTTLGCMEKIPCLWVRQDRKSLWVTALLSKERWGATLGREQQKLKRTSTWHGRKNTLKFNSPCVYYGVAKIGDDQVMNES